MTAPRERGLAHGSFGLFPARAAIHEPRATSPRGMAPERRALKVRVHYSSYSEHYPLVESQPVRLGIDRLLLRAFSARRLVYCLS